MDRFACALPLRNAVSCLVLIAVLLASSARAIAADEPLTVSSIAFEGNENYSDGVLTYQLKLEVGGPLDRELLERDVQTLYRFFRTVEAELTPDGDSKVRVLFRVTESDRVVAVRILGNDEFTKAEIFERLRTRRGYPLFDYAIQADEREIVRMLRERGFHFAEVRTSVVDGERGGKEVRFIITEGPEVDIDEIVFRGNVTFEKSVLQKVLASEESGFLGLGGDSFVQELVEKDVVALIQFYRDEGFRDARVFLDDIEFSEQKDEVVVTFDIDEGDRYVVTAVRVEGIDVFPGDRAKLDDLITLKAGQPLRQEEVLRTQQNLLGHYSSHAFYNVRVFPEDPIYAATATELEFVFRVVPGDLVAADRVMIEGNVYTKDKVIRRYIGVEPAGPLDGVEMRKSLQRLRDLGYFEDIAVDVRDTEDPARKDVVFRVREGNTGSINFSAGVSSNLGLVGQVTVTKRNFDYADLPERFGDVFRGRAFTGGGQTLVLHAAPGLTYSTFEIDFTEPWLFDRKLSFNFNLYRRLLIRPGYDIRRTGGTVTFGRRWRFQNDESDIDDALSLSVGFRVENPEIRSIDAADAPLNAIADAGEHRVRALRFGAAWTHLDSTRDPTRGYALGANVEVAGAPGSEDFVRTVVNGTTYKLLDTDRKGRHHILSFSGQAGWLATYGSPNRVIIAERFFLGGLGTVRGFGFRTVGPKSNREPTGGEGMYQGSLAYNFPIYERLFGGVLFADFGNVGSRWGGNDFLRDVRVGVGFGLKIAIPILGPRPLEFDLAYPLKRESGDDSQFFHFSFGRDF